MKKAIQWICLAVCCVLAVTSVVIVGVTAGQGKDGESAYELAVDNGYTGTQLEWLASLAGENGKDGLDGTDGKSAYDLAVAKGYTGTESEWLASLVGTAGENGQNGKSVYELAVEKGFEGTLSEWLDSLVGKDGVNGTNGTDGKDGKSAYDLAVEKGYEGTLTEWLDSLIGTDGINGKDGIDGKSAYDLAVENGYEGTLTEWLASLVGAAGTDGANGANGTDGTNGKSAYDLAVEKGYTGTVQEWLASLVGTAGKDGSDGKSAYELAVDNGYTGTQEEWLASLVGQKGDKGDQGDKGDDGLSAFEIYQKYHPEYTGTEEDWLETLKGESGAAGEQGVGIKNAYINEEYHLILILTNDTEIDAGYVGVTITEPTPVIYTVTFVDYDGTQLSTQTVEKGNAAVAPSDPTREGYLFFGWDSLFDNIESNTVITATYTKITQPTLIVSSVTAKAGDIVTITLSVVNNPGIMNAVLKLTFDDKVLTIIAAENGTALSSSTLTKPKYFVSGCNFVYDGLDISNTDNGIIITFTIKIPESAESGTVYDITISYVPGDICNGDLEEVTLDVINGTITIE